MFRHFLKICFHWQKKGECHREDSCKFRHPIKGKEPYFLDKQNQITQPPTKISKPQSYPQPVPCHVPHPQLGPHLYPYPQFQPQIMLPPVNVPPPLNLSQIQSQQQQLQIQKQHQISQHQETELTKMNANSKSVRANTMPCQQQT